MFLYYTNKENDDITGVPLKQYNIQSRISLEMNGLVQDSSK